MEVLGVLINGQNKNIVQLKKRSSRSLEICRIYQIFWCVQSSSVSPGIRLCLGGSLFWQMNLRLLHSFFFEMDTTPESYLDLFPLESIVYLTPDSENGKYLTCFRRGRTVRNFILRPFRASGKLFLSRAVSDCMRHAVCSHLVIICAGGTCGEELCCPGVCWERGVLCGTHCCVVLSAALFPVLEDIDPDKVYVLGGLVDESIHKVCGACPVSRDSPVLWPPPFPSRPACTPQRAGRGCSSASATSPGQALALWQLVHACEAVCQRVRVSLQQLTLRKAREQRLQTARLPIREYMVRVPNPRNYHCETLAINQGELPGAGGTRQPGGVDPCSLGSCDQAGDTRGWGLLVGL